MQVCFETQLPLVVDNTNITREQRAKYIELAKKHRFKVIGYYFQSKIHDCIERNENRPEAERIPKAGLLGASAKLELPMLAEGFDGLYYVKIERETNQFNVEKWDGANNDHT